MKGGARRPGSRKKGPRPRGGRGRGIGGVEGASARRGERRARRSVLRPQKAGRRRFGMSAERGAAPRGRFRGSAGGPGRHDQASPSDEETGLEKGATAARSSGALQTEPASIGPARGGERAPWHAGEGPYRGSPSHGWRPRGRIRATAARRRIGLEQGRGRDMDRRAGSGGSGGQVPDELTVQRGGLLQAVRRRPRNRRDSRSRRDSTGGEGGQADS